SARGGAGRRRRRGGGSPPGRGRGRPRRWWLGVRAPPPRHRGERLGPPLPEVECRDLEAKPQPSRRNLAHDRVLWEAPALPGAAETWAIPGQAAMAPSPGRTRARMPSRRSRDAAADARIAGVPREVVLLLPPSPGPPAVTDEALRAAVAGALGCAPGGLSDVRVRRMSFDARPRQRRWRLVVDAWSAGEP